MSTITIPDWVLENHPLASQTTWRVGGAAAYFGVVKNMDMLWTAIQVAREHELNIFILGAGSNLLVDDAGVYGLVIRLEGDFKKCQLLSPNEFMVGGGFLMPLLAKKMGEAGQTGFEFMVGIPGSVGGGVVINAGRGADEPCMGTILKSVCYIDETLQEKEESVKTLEMSYRSSRLKQTPAIVVSADFLLNRKDEPQAIMDHMRTILAERREKFPLNYPNAGSVFKGPDGYPPAGWLIEKAGLKGRQVGNAQISHVHANFIVNLGGATSADVKSLIELVQEEVRKIHGVVMEKEVMFWPEENNWMIW